METVAVNVRRVEAGVPDLETDLARARLLANWLDARFSIFGIRLGLDAIVGLIPVVGDCLTAGAAIYPIWVADRHNLGRALKTRMAMNVGIDWLIGLVPVIGDVFDVGFKANLRNVKLLEEAVEKMRQR